MQSTSFTPEYGLPDEAYRLADHLLTLAKPVKTGLEWEINSPGYDGQLAASPTINLADGSAGIVATLLNMYTATRAQKYFDAAVKGLDTLLDKAERSDSPYLGLYRGLGGIALLCAQHTRITGELDYPRRAISILSPRVDEFLKSPYTTNTILNGRAGALIAFLHLAASTGEKDTWKAPYVIADDLIKRARLHREGIFWRPYYPEAQPLCGLAEGTSGIAWAFAELAHLSGEHAWFIPADMALEYEIACLHDDRTPDYRKGIRTAEQQKIHLKKFREGDRSFFTSPCFHNGWGYGDTGTLLAWQRIAKISPEERYAPALPESEEGLQEECTDILSEELSRSIALHNAAVLLNDARPLVTTRNLSEAELKKAGTEDLRMLGGACGALQSLLIGASPVNTFDYFFPVPREAGSLSWPEKSSHEIRTKLLKQPFNRTISILEAKQPETLKEYMQQQPPSSSELRFFTSYMDEHFQNSNTSEVEELFNLEKDISEAGENPGSYAYRNVKEIARQEDAEKVLNLNDEAFAQRTMLRDPEIILKKTSRNWANRWNMEKQRPVSPPEMLEEEPVQTYVLLRLNATGTSVLENPLNQLSLFICEAYTSPRTLNEAITLFRDTFHIENEQQSQQAETLIREQVREFFNTGILISA